ncbi:papG chaperone-binding domain protein [Escherichia coli 2726800]|uniref:PapG chaperone-binding domain-containing protein n=1 Tax=Escherichia coli TaxID=562 RepID=UPI0002C99D55|nr:PapG chaperone-binding domain-containing protein [Escherichia coli]EMX79826.1 papG chaperone-binding domain protein [Escherichia coli 2726800]END36696.1 papG chaperone-binding domain protein [Escherichia coli 2854350]
MRLFVFFIFVLLQSIVPVFAVDNTYSFFWSSTAPHDVGNVSYNGGRLSNILVNVKDITPGPLSVTKNQCKRMWGEVWTDRSAYDYWIFIPKEVLATDNSKIEISIQQLPRDFSLIREDTNQYVLHKKIPESYNQQYKKCYPIGETYNFTSPWNSAFVLRLDTSSLGVGRYTGNIPIKISFAEYFKQTSGSSIADNRPIDRWSLAEAEQNLGIVSLPFDINIINVCHIVPNEINLDHGDNAITTADGHTISEKIYVNCVNNGKLNLRLSLKALTNPTVSYMEGVGVGLGNGWDSILKIDNANITSANPTTNITIPANSSISVSSMLRKTKNSRPGNLSGTAVMEILLQ